MKFRPQCQGYSVSVYHSLFTPFAILRAVWQTGTPFKSVRCDTFGTSPLVQRESFINGEGGADKSITFGVNGDVIVTFEPRVWPRPILSSTVSYLRPCFRVFCGGNVFQDPLQRWEVCRDNPSSEPYVRSQNCQRGVRRLLFTRDQTLSKRGYL